MEVCPDKLNVCSNYNYNILWKLKNYQSSINLHNWRARGTETTSAALESWAGCLISAAAGRIGQESRLAIKQSAALADHSQAHPPQRSDNQCNLPVGKPFMSV